MIMGVQSVIGTSLVPLVVKPGRDQLLSALQ